MSSEFVESGDVRRALHDAWLAVHVRRFDGDYDGKGRDVPEYAMQVRPDTIYNGTLRAEAAIQAVAESYGISYHGLRDLTVAADWRFDKSPSSPPRDLGLFQVRCSHVGEHGPECARDEIGDWWHPATPPEMAGSDA